MKKILIVCMSALLLCGCGKKQKDDPAVTPDTRESAPITQIDFTQADAEKLLTKAVADHCGQVSCKVTSVRISGSDIIGVYTYSSGTDEKSADVVLHNVSVSPADKTVYTCDRSEFKDNLPDIDGGKKDEKSDDQKTDGKDKEGSEEDSKSHEKGNYDLPAEVDESDESARDDQKVYDENGVQIWRIYSYKGTIEFTGTYSGDSKFIIQIMDLKQNVKGEPVNIKTAGDIDASMKLDEEGYYYVKIEAVGGWSLYWNRIYE